MRIGRPATARLVAEGGGCFRIEGDVVFSTVMKLLEDSELRFADWPHIELDLGGVTRINTAGLGLVIEWLRRVRRGGRTLSLRRPPTALLALARICEAEAIIAPIITPV